MKGFYIALAGIAVAGGAALVVMANRGGGSVPIGPIPPEAIEAGRDFPGYVDGSADAPVEIIEYADFQCPACQHFWLLTVRDIKERLVKTGRVRYIFRDFPLPMHDKSRVAHHAAACADEQGMFWPMHDTLFQTQNRWSGAKGTGEPQFRDMAEGLGLDLARYDDCMAAGRYRGRIQASYDSGVSLGVSSTPTYIIGNSLYNGMSYDEVKAIVDSLSREAGATSP